MSPPLLFTGLACVAQPERPVPSSDPSLTLADTGLAAPTLVLPGVTVIDAQGTRGPVWIVIEDERIVAVSEQPRLPDTAEVLDVEGLIVVPGLIDPHVHLFLSGSPWWVGDTLAANLRATLAAGITTVVDVGGPVASVALRRRQAAGELLGPALLALGPMVTAPGSHPCEGHYDPDFCSLVSTEAQGAAIGAERAAQGTDGIKLALADAAFTPWPTPRLDTAALAAAVAATPGLSVAHVDAPQDASDALDAGVQHLAHPVFGGPPSSQLAARIAAAAATHTTLGAFAGTLELLDGRLDPALAPDARVAEAWRWVADHPGSIDPDWILESELWLAEAASSLLLLEAAGAALLPASDAGYLYVPHGQGLHLELARLLELGFSPQELLVASTATAADALALWDRGRVGPGQRADLLVLGSDPLDDLAGLAQPAWVIQAGVVHDPAVLASTDALLEPADAQLGGFCLDDRDCAVGRCDRIAHACQPACDAPGLLADPCGPGAWCALSEGTSGEAVCQEVRTCDLYAPDTCAPQPYRERCVPLDLDTNGCFPAGTQASGEACDPLGIGLICGPGLLCSGTDGRCRTPCDPAVADPCPQPFSCRVREPMGHPWFGLCE